MPQNWHTGGSVARPDKGVANLSGVWHPTATPFLSSGRATRPDLQANALWDAVSTGKDCGRAWKVGPFTGSRRRRSKAPQCSLSHGRKCSSKNRENFFSHGGDIARQPWSSELSEIRNFFWLSIVGRRDGRAVPRDAVNHRPMVRKPGRGRCPMALNLKMQPPQWKRLSSEGAKHDSPGRSPGFRFAYNPTQAPTGRDKRPRVSPRWGFQTIICPIFPRALPWAILFRRVAA
jgi:hypothetical protein